MSLVTDGKGLLVLLLMKTQTVALNWVMKQIYCYLSLQHTSSHIHNYTLRHCPPTLSRSNYLSAVALSEEYYRCVLGTTVPDVSWMRVAVLQVPRDDPLSAQGQQHDPNC